VTPTEFVSKLMTLCKKRGSGFLLSDQARRLFIPMSETMLLPPRQHAGSAGPVERRRNTSKLASAIVKPLGKYHRRNIGIADSAAAVTVDVTHEPPSTSALPITDDAPSPDIPMTNCPMCLAKVPKNALQKHLGELCTAIRMMADALEEDDNSDDDDCEIPPVPRSPPRQALHVARASKMSQFNTASRSAFGAEDGRQSKCVACEEFLPIVGDNENLNELTCKDCIAVAMDAVEDAPNGMCVCCNKIVWAAQLDANRTCIECLALLGDTFL
jgi:hypothetical protein